MSLSLRTTTLGLILVTAVISLISLSSQASDPVAGTWELNLAASKFSSVPPLKSQTRTYEVTGQQEKMTGKGINAQGKPMLIQFTANRDGKDYPYEGRPGVDTISLTPVDAFTMAYTHKNAGALVSTGKRVISKDGKMMTITDKVTDATGQSVENILVFDKR